MPGLLERAAEALRDIFVANADYRGDSEKSA